MVTMIATFQNGSNEWNKRERTDKPGTEEVTLTDDNSINPAHTATLIWKRRIEREIRALVTLTNE